MIDDAGSKTVLKEICMSADLLAACREQIATDGLTIPTRNGSRDHPLIRTVLDDSILYDPKSDPLRSRRRCSKAYSGPPTRDGKSWRRRGVSAPPRRRGRRPMIKFVAMIRPNGKGKVLNVAESRDPPRRGTRDGVRIRHPGRIL